MLLLIHDIFKYSEAMLMYIEKNIMKKDFVRQGGFTLEQELRM